VIEGNLGRKAIVREWNNKKTRLAQGMKRVCFQGMGLLHE